MSDEWGLGSAGLANLWECYKGVVIIYGRRGRWNFENRSNSKCAPPQ